ncbi:Acetyltransferase (GNAT) domain-containing protein [Planococcus glaciei]|uniref:GNAT family N-acetyltransferase n=1 Tax=Planococcus glaciei TaxID=459472 RepID=UPI0008910AE6|nr:GNAT family N-acetyltransferase [Planococcus glaciei]SDI35665.1 Acetyltransferase (GNAT) domain-containing protein [Planococcus glaciei]
MTVKSKVQVPDIFFMPEWGKAYESQDQGESRIFEVKNAIGHIFYSFVLRPIPILAGETLYYDTVTPFGQNGPIILKCQPGKKAELIALFDQEFQTYCTQHNIVAEYIRFSAWLKNVEDFKDIYSIDNRGITMYIDLTVQDFFMEEFKSPTRQQVRRALKNNVQIEYDFTGESIQEFHRLYQIMAKRNDVPAYYLFSEELLKNSFELLEGKQFIVYVKHEGVAISAALFVHHGDYLHYHLAANDPTYFHLAGNSLLINEGCRWGVEHGKKELHLGGASTEALYRFKRGFTKTEPLDILTGKKIRNPGAYQLLSDIKARSEGIENPSHFPMYRG